jgi:hypothetical protein
LYERTSSIEDWTLTNYFSFFSTTTFDTSISNSLISANSLLPTRWGAIVTAAP